jgi:acetyl esterase/lipase
VLARHSPRPPRWSEDGEHLFWFEDGAWHRIDPVTLARTNLTANTPIRYETGERPEEATGSVGRLLPGGRELLVSDGFDLWAVPLDGGIGRNLTRNGGREKIRYRHVVLDDSEPYLDGGRAMLLTVSDDRTKAEGLARIDLETGRLERLATLDKDVGAPRRAKSGDRWLFTIQDSDQPPDLWVADGDFRGLRRISDANPWLRNYEMPKSELVTWHSLDGEELQGILMKPVGYEPGKRYPMIVYMYEKLSGGLHQFRAPGLNLNPQMWCQQGYAVLMPDIVYQIGRPGLSAVKCVVPAVQRVIDDGVADPARVGLCGHSWGGYETAFIITQTRLFAAAIAGAPVANMTSAYNGIRWSTGLPRQFQYERTQSRIGGSLWDYPERFVENSPIFHLPHVTTPVLIMFGNNDGAVPWWQGLEFYLGMRRLGKPAVLLEYKDEGHGLRGKANQEDYTRRIQEWFDHYLKGTKAAEWIEGPTSPSPIEGAPNPPSFPAVAPVASPAASSPAAAPSAAPAAAPAPATAASSNDAAR